MSALGVILRYRARATRNRIRGLRHESLLKIAVVTVVGGGLWVGLFVGSLRAFTEMKRFPELREDVIFTGTSLMFMALTVLLIFSGTIISLGSLFRNRETAFLMATPVPAGSVYAYKTADGLIFSSWAFFVMGLPPLLAYGIDVGASAAYYLALPLFFAPFTLMAASVGTLLGLAVAGLVPRRRGGIVKLLVAAAVIAGAIFSVRLIGLYRHRPVFTEQWKDSVLGSLSFLGNRYLPHTWLTRGILLSAVGRWSEAGTAWLAVATTGVFAYLLGDFVSRRLYGRAWSVVGSSGRRRSYRRGLFARATELVSRPAGRSASLFVSKDVRLFLRDPAQWSQFAIFFGLLAIYILNIRKLHYDFAGGFWQHLISTLNLGAMSLTLATLTTRFVFPQISLEGRRFWVLGLAPVRRRDVLYGKFAFSLGGALVVAETLVVLSNTMLRMPADVFLLQGIAAAFICTGLTGLAAGLGAVFPSYRETNPSRIVSGFGGTLTLVLSAAFVAAVVGSYAALSHVRLASAAIGPRAFVRLAMVTVGAAGAATALAAGLPLYYGVRALDRAEF